MTRFLSSGDRRHLVHLLQGKPVLAAVAYVSDASNLPLGRGDILVCDGSDAAARSGATRRDALAALLKKGVVVWSFTDLHAKVIVANGRVSVGSANWSARSASVLVEASIETSDPAVVKAASSFVLGLAKRPSVRVTQAFLRRMPKPEAALPADHCPPDENDDDAPCHWLVSLYPLNPRGAAARMADRMEQDGERLARTGVSPRALDYMVWSGPNGPGPKMQVDDTMTVIWHEPGEPTVVYPPCRVLRVRRAGNITGVLYLTTAQHERRQLSFRRFLALAKRADLPSRIGEGSNRELTGVQFEAMSRMWPKASRRRTQ